MADNTTTSFQAAAYTGRGTARDKVALPETLFDGTVNMPVMHQAVKAYLANQRQGNAATKIRKYVVGGNQKPWKQKGTGRARAGSTRAPHWVGGGTVFGPIPRSYAQYVPRQVRALARKSAFNARAREDAIFVIDRFEYDAPKTSRLKALVDRLGVGDKKVLILTDGVKTNVFLSGRNLPDSARDAVRRRLHVSHSLVGRRVDRSAARLDRRWRRSPRRKWRPKKESGRAKNVKVEAAPAKKPAKKAAAAKAEKAPAKKPAAKAKAAAKEKAPAKKAAAKAKRSRPPSRPKRRGSRRCRLSIAPSCVR